MRIIVAFVLAVMAVLAQAKPATLSETKPTVAIKKPKLLRSNPHRYTAINLQGVNPWDAVDDEDILPQRRYRFKLEPVDSDELSDYIKIRLLVARARALGKFVETHGQVV